MAKKAAREAVILPVNLLEPTDSLRHTDSELDALATSFRRIGMLHPIVVSDRQRCRVVAGHGRLAAAKRAGLTHVPVLIAPDLDDPDRKLLARLDENLHRKPFSPSEIADISARLRPVLEAEAVQRQKATQMAGKDRDGKPKTFGSTKLVPPKPPQPRVQRQVADAVGVSHGTLDKIEAMREAAKRDPATYGHLLELADKTSVHRAFCEFQRLQAHDRKHEAPSNDGEPGTASGEAGPAPQPATAEPPPAGHPDLRAARVKGVLRGVETTLAGVLDSVKYAWSLSGGAIEPSVLADARAKCRQVVLALGGEVTWE
ncbi:MAG TPA: ParB N-terminal domain-containing protein [Planctomycetota bacterium]|nr:ParB N-terminal domain-containing protein [Planctomycetota bacterium]HRR82918.1 ParB N-terminal domain-containing protein [Planctomycetota bacterium]HRT95772.1 ParB N-terminal domain-containing protein [Planctomycetota bacterium]